MQQKIKTPCKKCGTMLEQDGKASMKRCTVCGKKWHLSINVDGSPHLYICRPRINPMNKKVPTSLSVSKQEIIKASKAGFSSTDLYKIGYRIAVLGLDKDTAMSIITNVTV